MISDSDQEVAASVRASALASQFLVTSSEAERSMRRQPDAEDVSQIIDVVRDIVIDGEIHVSTDGVEAVVTLSRSIEVQHDPAFVVPVPQQFEDGREVDAAPSQIMVDARHAVLLLRRRGGVA